jgi:hypothetical protein
VGVDIVDGEEELGTTRDLNLKRFGWFNDSCTSWRFAETMFRRGEMFDEEAEGAVVEVADALDDDDDDDDDDECFDASIDVPLDECEIENCNGRIEEDVEEVDVLEEVDAANAARLS